MTPELSNPFQILLRHGTHQEEFTRSLLMSLLTEFDLSKWMFTEKAEIDEHISFPHSFPIITLPCRYENRETLLLTNFIHEQLHWFLASRKSKVREAMMEFKSIYPHVPGYPEGGRTEMSTYLHIAVNFLEHQALRELLGPDADAIIAALSNWIYGWIYKVVLEDGELIEDILRRHELLLSSG